MGEKKYSVVLTVVLVIIIIAIVGLLGFVAYNYISTKNSTQQASDFVDSFTDMVSSTDNGNTTIPNGTATTDVIAGFEDENDTTANTVDQTEESNTITTSSGKKKATYKGFETLGTIQIPKTNVKYPILAKMSNTSLKTAPVAIYPMDVKLNSVGNVVIVGHNFRNGTFFSNNKQLNIGDKIYITDLEGNKVTYVIYNKFETIQTDTRSYNKDTNGKREITLSTCTDAGNDQRLIIEAREE